MTRPNSFVHIVLETDSLGLPRPWNAKRAEEAPEQFFRYRETYPYLLLRLMRDACPDSEVLVTNLGQRASTMAWAVANGGDLLKHMDSSAAIIHHGIVDCWLRKNEVRRLRVMPDEFRIYVNQIIDMKTKLAAKIPLIFIGIMPTTAAMLARVPEQNDIIAQYNDILRECVIGKAILFDVERMFSHMIEQVVHLDGHHLSRTGHRLYADELFRLLLVNGVGA